MQWIVFLACDITWPCAEQMAATWCSPGGLILKQSLSLADLSQENRCSPLRSLAQMMNLQGCTDS